MDSSVIETEYVLVFKSPPRILARSFRRSRDQWKKKCMVAKTEIKKYKNQASDARRSREKWKDKAAALEARVRQLEAAPPASEQEKKLHCPAN